MPQAFYNEIDPFAAAWLRELIDAGHIAPGVVDERSITEIEPEELSEYTQVHLFAGIGGWSHALRLAGWPDDRPVWTGSCPCQPFSSAGKQKGTDDDQHLWPEMFRLVRACRPQVVFGEQVASAEVVGTELEASFVVAVQRGDYARANKLAKRLAQSHSLHYHRRWVDGVRADMASVGYALRHAVLGAHSVGAPHIRQRLWWVADADGARSQEHGFNVLGEVGRGAFVRCQVGRVADTAGEGRGRAGSTGVAGGRDADELGRLRATVGLVDPLQPGLEGHAGHGDDGDESRRLAAGAAGPTSAAGATGFWSAFDLVACRDGKARRVEPGSFPLVDGAPARVGRLRGYGNAIVPQAAAAFVRAYIETVTP